MPKLSVTYRVQSNRNLVKKGAEHLRAKVPLIAKKRFKAASKELKDRMSTPGKKIGYPVKWDNDRQRIAVIIKLKGSKRAQRKAGGFKNLPYKRTNKHIRGFKTKELKLGFQVYNSFGTSIYLYGDAHGLRQSRIHKGRHPLFARQAEIVMNKLPETVRREMVALVKELPAK